MNAKTKAHYEKMWEQSRRILLLEKLADVREREEELLWKLRNVRRRECEILEEFYNG